MTEESVPTRRRFLAGLTTVTGTAIAGCSSYPWEDDETSTAIPATEAKTILSDPLPDVDFPVPVVPESAAVEDGLERVDELLDDLPEPVTADEVPNGVVRESIVDARETALEGSDEGTESPETYHVLRETRDRRDAAQEAITTFEAIEDDGVWEALEDERVDRQSTLEDRLEAADYRGEDSDDGRLRAALTWYRLEDDLESANQGLERLPIGPNATVIELGESAGSLEFATATVDVWDHLLERYDQSRSTSDDFEPVFATTLEQSIDAADDVELPSRDTDDWYEEVAGANADDPSVQMTLWRPLRQADNAREGMTAAFTDDRLGIGLADTLEFEQAFRAFETIRTRVENGEIAVPETADEIETERNAAVSALESATEVVGENSIGAYLFAKDYQSLRWTDDRIDDLLSRNPDGRISLTSQYDDYVRLRARLEVLPDAVEAFRERLLEREAN